jgi:hypothetical protein
LINQFKETYIKAVSETNTFFNTDWLTYKLATEKIQISKFKETKIYSTNKKIKTKNKCSFVLVSFSFLRHKHKILLKKLNNSRN